MNHFAVFENDSDSECGSVVVDNVEEQEVLQTECEDVAVEKEEVVAKVEVSEESESQLTVKNLTEHSTKSAVLKNPGDKMLSVASNILYSLMKNYHKLHDIEKTQHHRAYDFLSCMSEKSKSFFTTLFFDSEGDYSGTYVSITSWKYSKKPDGSPLYLYLATSEDYGSCSFCDGYEALSDALWSIKWRIRENMAAAAKLEERDPKKRDLKNQIKNDLTEFRQTIEEDTLSNFRSIQIFKTYEEAKAYINRYDDFEIPTFKEALLKARPDIVLKPPKAKTETFNLSSVPIGVTRTKKNGGKK